MDIIQEDSVLVIIGILNKIAQCISDIQKELKAGGTVDKLKQQ